MSALDELREFASRFAEYKAILDDIGRRGGGEHWFTHATPEERARVDALRADLNRRYGRIRSPLATALGGIPILGNAYTTAGEVPQVALMDPADNPWIESALDGTVQAIAMAIGHYETQPTPARPAPEVGPAPSGRRIGRVVLSTGEQVLVAVLTAAVLGALALLAKQFGVVFN